MKVTEVTVLAGKKWAEMSEAEKKPFVQKNLDDKVRQEK
jgi:HMG (high mobility group) box